MAEEIKQTQLEENKDVKEGKIWALLSYLGPLCLLPLLVKKDNKFILYHGKQGLVLFIGEFIVLLISFISILKGLIGFISLISGWVFAVYSIIGMLQSLKGNYWKAPVVADLAEKIDI